MTDGNENDYQFIAEEECKRCDTQSIQAASGQTEATEGEGEMNTTGYESAAVAELPLNEPANSASGTETYSAASVNTQAPKTLPDSANQGQPELEIMRNPQEPEAAIATPHTAFAVPQPDGASQAPFCAALIKEPKRRKNSGRLGALLRRGIGFLAAAALFGCVAAGAFIGFNELYYHLNPAAKPSFEGGSSQTPDSGSSKAQPLISHTAVADGTSVATADVSGIVENAMPSLVSISCTFRNTTSFFGYLYEGTSEGAGSGIIVGQNDEELLIATNNHVVDDAVTTTVTFLDGSQVAASVRGTEETADLAIVSVPLADISEETRSVITVASLGNSDDAKVGQMVIAIGNALGYGQTTTVGYLSAKEREVTVTDSSTGKTTKYTALQVDAAINPGNSGGALLDTQGKVIGINSAKLSSTKVEGIGYSIPINDAIDILDELMNREILTEEEQGYLGVYLSDQEITSEISRLYGFPSGVYIAEVVAGGAADQAGILPGDIITAIEGSPVTARTQLQEKVKTYRSGTGIEVTLSRLENGKYVERTITVILGSKTDFE